ncbi:hypothetical protein HFN60_30210 [Rhizobium leguminosarum]|uniref:hypothetical protein n=1 Tax=Rhizobium leguminosarum TaxID=384 RepID=UPI001C942576|nr:hypothetical protein [Rhizobium leguminosarum]MBY5819868.1 hypothetical protein [Rhizobium leguminosarum]
MTFISKYFDNRKYQQDAAEYDALKNQSHGPSAFLRGADQKSRDKIAAEAAAAKPPVKKEILRTEVENIARNRSAKGAVATANMLAAEMPPEADFKPAPMNSQRAVEGIEHFQVSVVGAFRNRRTGEEYTVYRSNFKGDTKLTGTGNLAIDATRVERPKEDRQDAEVFFARRKVRGRDGQMVTDPKLAFRHENESELILNCCHLAGVRPPASALIRAQEAKIKAAKEANIAAGWPIKEKIDPRQINKAAGIRQGNVIRPQFPAYQERPSPSMKNDQEPLRQHAI